MFVDRCLNDGIAPVEDSFDDHRNNGNPGKDSARNKRIGGNVGKTVPPADPEEREADTSQNDGDVADKS